MQPDWPERVVAAMAHLEKGRRVYSATDSLTVINDVVAGLGPTKIEQKNGFKSDLIGTALGHVTTAIHGSGNVPPLAEGGWYERKNDSYAVAPGFAAAWKAKA